MTIDSNDLALDSDSSSLDSGSDSNSTGFFQPGKLYMKSLIMVRSNTREGDSSRPVGGMSFVKENSLISDRFGSRALAHLLIAPDVR